MTEPQRPTGNEIAPLLWVIAVLIGCYDLVLWIFQRMYH
jgi:hypothetical protein